MATVSVLSNVCRKLEAKVGLQWLVFISRDAFLDPVHRGLESHPNGRPKHRSKQPGLDNGRDDDKLPLTISEVCDPARYTEAQRSGWPMLPIPHPKATESWSVFVLGAGFGKKCGVGNLSRW